MSRLVPIDRLQREVSNMIFIITRATESARKTVGKLFADIRRWKCADMETFCPTVRLTANSFMVRSMPGSSRFNHL
jgi:hypothetical protein